VREPESSLTKDTGISLAVHAAIAGILYLLLLAHRSQAIVANIDMTLSTLTVQRTQTARIEDEWVLPNPQLRNRHALKKKLDTPVPVVEQSVWIPAAQTARQPKWVGNFIDPETYPTVARQQGGDGKVVLLVHIDAVGKVQEVRLVNGSNYDVLNEFAVGKVKNGIFTPAYNRDGSPVACEVILPIIFKLDS